MSKIFNRLEIILIGALVFLSSFGITSAATCAGIFVGGTGVCYGNGYINGIVAHTVLLGEGINQLGTTSPNNAGYVLTSNGTSADPTFQPAVTSSPAGTSGQLQYNASGSFGGVATSSTGTANTIPALDAASHTTIPYASTTALTVSGLGTENSPSFEIGGKQGLYVPYTGAIGFAAGSAANTTLVWDGAQLAPFVNKQKALGEPNNLWSNVYTASTTYALYGVATTTVTENNIGDLTVQNSNSTVGYSGLRVNSPSGSTAPESDIVASVNPTEGGTRIFEFDNQDNAQNQVDITQTATGGAFLEPWDFQDCILVGSNCTTLNHIFVHLPNGSNAFGLGTSSVDQNAAFQISSSTAPRIFEADTNAGTHIFSVQASGATTTALTISSLSAGTLNATASGLVYNTATSSLTVNSPLTTTGTAGALIGGTALTIGCPTASGSQAGCLSAADWTTFNSKGSGSGNIATSSAETSGYFPVWTSTAGTPATLAGTSQLFQLGSNIGIASATPGQALAVNGTAYFGSTSGEVRYNGVTTLVVQSLTGASSPSINITNDIGTTSSISVSRGGSASHTGDLLIQNNGVGGNNGNIQITPGGDQGSILGPAVNGTGGVLIGSVGGSEGVSLLQLAGTQSYGSWTTRGAALDVRNATYYDNSSTPGTTISQRALVSFEQQVLAFTTGTSTVTTGITEYVQGGPTSDAASSTAMTNSVALYIGAGSLASGGVVTNGYGLSVNAPTGATNNYAAQFLGGNVGIGSALPDAFLDIATTSTAAPTVFSSLGQATVFIRQTSASLQQGYGALLDFGSLFGTKNLGPGIASVQTTADPDQTGLAFFTHPSSSTNSNIVQQMELDAGGDLLLGTTTVPTTGNSTPTVSSLCGSTLTTPNCINFAVGTGNGNRTLEASTTGNGYGFQTYFTNVGSVTGNLNLEPYGGFVGVGTSSPSTLLEVQGTSNVSTLASPSSLVTMRLDNLSQTNNSFVSIAFGGTTDTTNLVATTTAQISAVATSHTANQISGDLAFLTNNAGTLSEGMRLTATNHLGIASSSPGTSLVVNGATTFYGGAAAPTLANGMGYITTSSSGGILIGGQGSSNDFQILNKSGNVLLSVGTGGTALSGTSLDLTNAPFLGTSGTAGLGGSATLGGIYAGNGTTNDVTIENNAAAAVMSVPTGTTNAMFAGSVGIGTSTVNANLNVNQSTINTNALEVISISDAIGSGRGSADLYLERGNSGGGGGKDRSQVDFLTGTSTLNWAVGTQYNNGQLSPNFYISQNDSLAGTGLFSAGLPAFTIATNNNVGIGTTTPGSIFSVQGVGNFVANSTSTLWNGLTAQYFSSTSTTATSTFADGLNITGGCYALNGTCIVGDAGFTNTLASGGTATTTFYSGGPVFSDGTKLTQAPTLNNWSWDNVNFRMGIGTSTPHWAEELAGSRPQAQLALTDTAASTNLKHWLFTSIGGNLYIGTSTDLFASSTIPALTISPNGYLGVGTSTPAQPLSVMGMIYSAIGGYMFPDGTVQATRAKVPTVYYAATTTQSTLDLQVPVVSGDVVEFTADASTNGGGQCTGAIAQTANFNLKRPNFPATTTLKVIGSPNAVSGICAGTAQYSETATSTGLYVFEIAPTSGAFSILDIMGNDIH